MATKTNKNSNKSLTDRLDSMIDKVADLASDVNDGDITANQILERLDKICTDLANMRDFL